MAAKKKEVKEEKKAGLIEAFKDIEKPYTLRKLKETDLVPMLRILRKLGLKSFKKAFVQIADGKSIKEIGVDVAFDMADIMIEALDSEKAAADIYALCASLSGISEEDLLELEFGTVLMMIFDIVQGAKETTFFKVLAKSL